MSSIDELAGSRIIQRAGLSIDEPALTSRGARACIQKANLRKCGAKRHCVGIAAGVRVLAIGGQNGTAGAVGCQWASIG